MDAVVLTWRWQNLLTIWAMIVLLYFAVTFGTQIVMRMDGNNAANE